MKNDKNFPWSPDDNLKLTQRCRYRCKKGEDNKFEWALIFIKRKSWIGVGDICGFGFWMIEGCMVESQRESQSLQVILNKWR